MSGPKRNPDKLNTIGVVVVGICGAVLVYVTIVALQAFYMNNTSEIQTMADYGGQDMTAKGRRADEMRNITEAGKNAVGPGQEATFRIPIKDALILSKSEDPAFRRAWRQRIVDHDGDGDDPGGIARWERLAAAVGLLPGQLGIVHVLPGVRFACDAYVELVRDAPLVVAVASSLTEAFAPDLMSKRIAAWETHYPWVDREGLTYFRERIPRARRDGADALDYVADNAVTPQLQAACVAALVRKTEVLWHLLDCVERGATC